MDITNLQQTKQSELQFLGFLGIIKESIRLIGSRWCIIFFQICAIFIFPLTSRVLLALTYGSSYTFLTETIFNTRLQNFLLDQSTSDGSAASAHPPPPVQSFFFGASSPRHLISRFVFLSLDVFLSIFPISFVAHTVVSIYTGDEFSTAFRKLERIVPKEWKRLLGTFLASFLVVIFVTKIVILLSSAITWVIFLPQLSKTVAAAAAAAVTVRLAFLVLLFVGLIWFGVLTQLALVIASLEVDIYGFQALVKSKDLVKGKLRLAMPIFLFGPGLGFVMYTWWFLYGKFVMDSVIGFVGYSLTLMFFTLFQIVNNTVFYFVCKSSVGFQYEDHTRWGVNWVIGSF